MKSFWNCANFNLKRQNQEINGIWWFSDGFALCFFCASIAFTIAAATAALHVVIISFTSFSLSFHISFCLQLKVHFNRHISKICIKPVRVEMKPMVNVAHSVQYLRLFAHGANRNTNTNLKLEKVLWEFTVWLIGVRFKRWLRDLCGLKFLVVNRLQTILYDSCDRVYVLGSMLMSYSVLLWKFIPNKKQKQTSKLIDVK